MAPGVGSYIFLCWGSILCGAGKSHIFFLFSLFFGNIMFSAGGCFGLPAGVCYMCVCVGMAHLFSVGERTGV